MVATRWQPFLSRIACAVIICGALRSEANRRINASDDLELLRSEARTTGPFDPQPAAPAPPKPAQRDRANNYSPCDDSDDEAESLFAGTIIMGTVVVAASPFWGPAFMVGDDYSVPGFFPRYPYQRPLEGHLMIDPDVPRKPRNWSGRVQFEQGGDFDDLFAWNGGLLVETTSRFGIDSRVHYFTQDLSTGGSDDLWLGDANLVFRFAQSPNLEMRTGVGFNWLADRGGSDFGFNFTYGGDWYPVRPFIVSSEIDWGEIGHSSLFHGRVTAGVQWHRAEVYVGYDYLDVGRSEFNTCVAGVRLWF